MICRLRISSCLLSFAFLSYPMIVRSLYIFLLSCLFISQYLMSELAEQPPIMYITCWDVDWTSNSLGHLIDTYLQFYTGSKSLRDWLDFSTPLTFVLLLFQIAAICLKCKTNSWSMNGCSCLSQIWYSLVHSAPRTRQQFSAVFVRAWQKVESELRANQMSAVKADASKITNHMGGLNWQYIINCHLFVVSFIVCM